MRIFGIAIMSSSRTYLVPVDFSRGSEAALRNAIKMARESRGKLLLVHVISTTMIFPSEGFLTDYMGMWEKDARERLRRLALRARLRRGEYRDVLVRDGDIARAIADRARSSRAAMIIMGSHGRTGLKRFMLGSVAERTLRYAQCPVLIVKK